MNRLKLGLVGLGKWPRQAYLPVLKELDAAEITAAAARTAESRQFARDQFGEQIAVYADYRDLLRDENVDAVMLALPNELHTAAVEAALGSGKHVFYEPPLGHGREEIRRLLAGMADGNRVVQADLELRYLPVVRAVCDLLAAGTIGKALMARITLWCDWGYGGGDWGPDVEKEGFFPWLGCWYLDVLDCVFGSLPLRADVLGGYAASGRLMDHGWASLEYRGGGIGQFEFNLVAVEGLEVRLAVLGSKGELRADIVSGRCRWRQAGSTQQVATYAHSEPAHGFVGMRESIVDFVAAIRCGRPPKAGVDVARRVHAGMLACARSETERTSVRADPLD